MRQQVRAAGAWARAPAAAGSVPSCGVPPGAADAGGHILCTRKKGCLRLCVRPERKAPAHDKWVAPLARALGGAHATRCWQGRQKGRGVIRAQGGSPQHARAHAHAHAAVVRKAGQGKGRARPRRPRRRDPWAASRLLQPEFNLYGLFVKQKKGRAKGQKGARVAQRTLGDAGTVDVLCVGLRRPPL